MMNSAQQQLPGASQNEGPTDVKGLILQLWSLQKRVYGSQWKRDIEATLPDYVTYIVEELGEVLKESNHKKHKPKKSINMDALRKEIVDVIIYSLDLGGLVFETPEELVEAVSDKANYNNTRNDWSEDVLE